jgi:hypothetical protein
MAKELFFKYKEPKDGLNSQGEPVKIYKRENTPDYYLFAPKEPTRNGEIKQLMLHCINEMGRQKNRYVFSLTDYFSFHNVTPDLIPEIKQAIIEIKAMINPIWYNEFTPLIKEWIENWNVQESLPPDKNRENITFKNTFDKVDPIEVYNHFKAGLVDAMYLSEKDLNEYLKMAFELKTIPEKKFKFTNRASKEPIQTVFHLYYRDVADKVRGTQKEYLGLLGNYFEGYNIETLKTNWARGSKIKTKKK